MRTSRFAAYLMGAATVMGMTGRLYADLIALNTAGMNQSNVYVYADDYDQPTSNSNGADVNSLPYSTPVSTTAGASNSTLTPTLTSSSLGLAFSQLISDNGDAGGDGDIFFTAGQAISYSLSGSLTSTGTDYTAELYVTLYDQTQRQYVYYYDQMYTDVDGILQDTLSPDIKMMEPSNTLTLDDQNSDPETSGFLNGVLTAGDTYEFYAEEDISNASTDPGLMGSVGLSFAPSVAATPLPRSLPAAALLLALTAAARFRRWSEVTV